MSTPQEGLAAVSDSHPDSEEFRSLPAEIQHEVLSELKEQKKYHSLSRINKMPEVVTFFLYNLSGTFVELIVISLQ